MSEEPARLGTRFEPDKAAQAHDALVTQAAQRGMDTDDYLIYLLGLDAPVGGAVDGLEAQGELQRRLTDLLERFGLPAYVTRYQVTVAGPFDVKVDCEFIPAPVGGGGSSSVRGGVQLSA